MGLGKNRFYYTLRVRVLEELKKRQVPRYISGFLTRHGTVAQSGQLAYLKAISNLRPALWSVLVRNSLPGTGAPGMGRTLTLSSDDSRFLNTHSVPSVTGVYQERRLVHTCTGHVK